MLNFLTRKLHSVRHRDFLDLYVCHLSFCPWCWNNRVEGWRDIAGYSQSFDLPQNSLPYAISDSERHYCYQHEFRNFWFVPDSLSYCVLVSTEIQALPSSYSLNLPSISWIYYWSAYENWIVLFNWLLHRFFLLIYFQSDSSCFCYCWKWVSMDYYHQMNFRFWEICWPLVVLFVCPPVNDYTSYALDVLTTPSVSSPRIP